MSDMGLTKVQQAQRIDPNAPAEGIETYMSENHSLIWRPMLRCWEHSLETGPVYPRNAKSLVPGVPFFRLTQTVVVGRRQGETEKLKEGG